ncbi:hypothetical protein J6590_062791 [Homalodisca vitripennis]|nr:hypothetical protein J6590_062791 [Homalodisca vitripennis]
MSRCQRLDLLEAGPATGRELSEARTGLQEAVACYRGEARQIPGFFGRECLLELMVSCRVRPTRPRDLSEGEASQSPGFVRRECLLEAVAWYRVRPPRVRDLSDGGTGQRPGFVRRECLLEAVSCYWVRPARGRDLSDVSVF